MRKVQRVHAHDIQTYHPGIVPLREDCDGKGMTAPYAGRHSIHQALWEAGLVGRLIYMPERDRIRNRGGSPYDVRPTKEGLHLAGHERSLRLLR
jgi:hypothetical protein